MPVFLAFASFSDATQQKVLDGIAMMAQVCCGISFSGRPEMPDKKPRPYAERGVRLKARRLQLQNDGALPKKLVEVAEKYGVSTSAIGQWERGETWITPKHRPKVLQALDWTEAELDHGSQRGEVRDGMAYHPVGPRELEFLALFRAFENDPDAQADLLHNLRAKVAARQALQQNMRGKLRPVRDDEVRTKMPATTKPPGKKATKRT